MRHLSTTYLSWIALLVAIALWGGVGYFAWTISSEESARASRAIDLEQESVQRAAAFRLHMLARETKDARAQLEEIAHAEVIEILDSIEAVGRDAEIPVEIGQALSESSPDSSSPIRAVSFVIEAEGSFAKVTHVAALLESLPVPSTINELHFERLPQSAVGSGKGAGGVWRMVARMRFLTTADISS